MIVVTGSTGAIGTQLLPLLLAAGEEVRVIARDPARLPRGAAGRIDVVQGSIDDPAALDRAFAGAHALFWLIPLPAAVDDIDAYYRRFSEPAARAIAAQGVGHVVVVSGLYGRALAARTGQAMPETLLGRGGAACRALWCAGFMENLLAQVPSLAGQGLFFGARRPDLRAPLVAARDIAATAAGLLLDGSWTGQGGVAVLGPEDLAQEEMAGIMGEVLGRPIRYRQVPTEAVTAQFVQAGMSAAVAGWLAEMGALGDEDPSGGEPRTPANSTPTTFRRWCEEVLKPAMPS